MACKKIINNIIFIVIIVLFSAGRFAEADSESARTHFPYAVITPDTIDIGHVVTGAVISGSIRITNEGAYDLVIAKARSSCGLMIQTWPAAPVKPGDSVVINFRFDHSRPGPVNRLITIHTNAWQKNLVVPVRGEVVPAGGG